MGAVQASADNVPKKIDQNSQVIREGNDRSLWIKIVRAVHYMLFIVIGSPIATPPRGEE